MTRDTLCKRATAGMVSGVRKVLWLWSWIVSIAEVDRRRSAWNHLRRKAKVLGLASSARAMRGESASEAGLRWRNRKYGGGLTVSESELRHLSVEGASG